LNVVEKENISFLTNLKNKLYKWNHIKSSKPTQAQGLCGLTHCYVDARTGALLVNNKD
jgi:hypothetical protein